MDFKIHGAKIKCQNSTCVIAYHPDCAKKTEGVAFHEGPINEVKRQGIVGKTRGYTLWCETHNLVSLAQHIPYQVSVGAEIKSG